MKVRDTDFSDILLDEKSYWKYYKIKYKNFMAAKPLGIRFNEIDKFMKIYHGTRYLVLLGHIWYDKIGDSIKYLISGKSGITDSINCNFGRIRIDSYNSLPIEKI